MDKVRLKRSELKKIIEEAVMNAKYADDHNPSVQLVVKTMRDLGFKDKDIVNIINGIGECNKQTLVPTKFFYVQLIKNDLMDMLVKLDPLKYAGSTEEYEQIKDSIAHLTIGITQALEAGSYRPFAS